MRYEGETEPFGKVEEIYGRRKHLREIREFGRIFWERYQRKGDKTSREKKSERKREEDKDRVKSRGRGFCLDKFEDEYLKKLERNWVR